MGQPAPVFPQGEIWRALSVTTFVSVGNATQSFRRLLDAISSGALQLPQPVMVQYGNTPFQGSGCSARAFLGMVEFGRFMTESELLILHAGAGSVIHAIQAGKIPVVMPRLAKYGEHIDDHQLEFARAMAEAGKIVLAEEPGDLLDAVAEAMRQQRTATPSADTPQMVGLIGAVLREHARG